jgi:hypothetical protein
MILKEYTNIVSKKSDTVKKLNEIISSGKMTRQDFLFKTGFSSDRLEMILNGKVEPTLSETQLIMKNLIY